MPSKGFRDRFIGGLNTWLGVPPDVLGQIQEVVSMLHNASLMYVESHPVTRRGANGCGRLDDFQDGSPKRRGKPSTHMIFGPAQAVNSSSYMIVKAIDKIMEFAEPSCTQGIISESHQRPSDPQSTSD